MSDATAALPPPPPPPPPPSPALPSTMNLPDRRALAFASEDDVIADLARLGNGYRKLGNWTLGQACGHVAHLIETFTGPAADDAEPTPQQAAMQQGFFARARAPRGFDGMPAPNAYVPEPGRPDDADVDRLVAGMRRLKAFPHARVAMGPLGPAGIEDCRLAHVAHAAHHLSFLVPMTPARRDGLAFADEDAAVADIERLRGGCAKAGAWSLPQVCWHLGETIRMRMRPGPFPQNTPEQDARRPALGQALSSGRLPPGLQAPDSLVPPPDADDAAVDGAIATLRQFRDYHGPLAPHRLFGHMDEPTLRKLNLIHCAHHLSHLVPLAADGA